MTGVCVYMDEDVDLVEVYAYASLSPWLQVSPRRTRGSVLVVIAIVIHILIAIAVIPITIILTILIITGSCRRRSSWRPPWPRSARREPPSARSSSRTHNSN